MYLDSPYTLTEGRVLFEIARRPAVEASWLRSPLETSVPMIDAYATTVDGDGDYVAGNSSQS